MRFMSRGLFGLALLVITAGILLGAASILRKSFEDDGDARGFRGGSRERVFAVEYDVVKRQTATPVITSFGEITSGRTLELRAALGGAVVFLSDNFREGGKVEAGELLFQTDPAAPSADLRLKQTLLTEAEAEQSEAKAALGLAEDELTAAKRQLDLRNDALARQKKLRTRGVGTEAALETASLSASSAEQSVLAKRQSVANAVARINRAVTSLERAKINLDEAQRKLNDTRVVAGFDGALVDVTAVAGGLVNANERLGRLIDPSALEVSVRLSSAEFARMSDDNGTLRAADIIVQFSAMEDDVKGKIDRVSAAVGQGQTGRTVFASLDVRDARFLRVGDFVTVQVTEPELNNVAVIPTTAANSSGDVLLVGADDRLEAATVMILRQQAKTLIIDPTGVEGKRLVLKRAPQLGAGILVRPTERTQTDASGKEPTVPLAQNETIILTDEQRDKMLAFVEGNKRMPKDAKERVMKKLKEPEIPKSMYDRITRNMGS